MKLDRIIVAATLAIAILGWSALAFAQADFYKGKTITVIAGTTAGALVRSVVARFGAAYGETYSGASGDDRAKHAGRGSYDRGELSVQQG